MTILETDAQNRCNFLCIICFLAVRNATRSMVGYWHRDHTV